MSSSTEKLFSRVVENKSLESIYEVLVVRDGRPSVAPNYQGSLKACQEWKTLNSPNFKGHLTTLKIRKVGETEFVD